MILIKILAIALIVLVALFVLSFIIYIFNLDMKAASLMGPIMIKWYDKSREKRMKRKGE